MNKRAFSVALLVLVIFGSWVWLYFTLRPKGIDPDPYLALGEAAAEETVKLLNNTGRLVVVDADFGDYRILAPINEAQLGAFKKAIKKSQLRIDAFEKVSIAPPTMARSGIFMQPGQISNLMARHPDVEAIVLFVGLAGPDDFKADNTAGKKRKVVLVSNYEPYYKRLLQKGVVQLAIVPRADAGANQDDTVHSRRQWFERHYWVATPERVAQLP